MSVWTGTCKEDCSQPPPEDEELEEGDVGGGGGGNGNTPSEGEGPPSLTAEWKCWKVPHQFVTNPSGESYVVEEQCGWVYTAQ